MKLRSVEIDVTCGGLNEAVIGSPNSPDVFRDPVVERRASVTGDGVRTHAGMTPYYRRKLRSGATAVYLRGPRAAKLRIVVDDPEALRVLHSGKSYTIEETPTGRA